MLKYKLIPIVKKVLWVGVIFIVSLTLAQILIVKNIKVVNVEEVKGGRGYVSLQVSGQTWVYEYETKEGK